MHGFVADSLRRLPSANTDAEIESMLEWLATALGFRSAYMLDFPSAPDRPIQLWDSNPERAEWWREQTSNGTNSISRSLAETLARGGVRHLTVEAYELRYALARRYDFAEITLVPIVFDDNMRGVVSFSGQLPGLDDISVSLQIVCYSLLVQARSIRQKAAAPTVSLTPREREVVELSATGLTSEMVAGQLGMSARTVNQHIDNVAFKLKTRNRVHTIAEALRQRLLR